MENTLRILFLFFLFVTGILFTIRKGPTLTPTDLKQIILDFLMLPAAMLTVVLFALIITRTDPRGLILELSRRINPQSVSFISAIPDNLDETLSVSFVERQDTDGDQFEEWVVFYEFDLQSGRNPIQVSIYNSDRGNPPVIFPYQLRVPNREYLSENSGGVGLSMVDVTVDQNGPDGNDLPEIMVSNSRQISFFRFEQNSEPWDFPRDTPPRYDAIGFFEGSGGVRFNSSTKDVTVIDRDLFDRSQLAVRSIYALNQVTNSYWDNFNSSTLAAPVVSTIDFFQSPPDDILNTAYPEKIVLAFYASTCGAEDKTLCRHADAGWTPPQFLTSDAQSEFVNGNPGYFGLPALSGNQNLSVSNLRYYPGLEAESGRRIVTGQEPQANIVEITFAVNQLPLETVRYEMRLVEGQWKLSQRVPLDTLVVDSPSGIEVPRQ